MSTEACAVCTESLGMFFCRIGLKKLQWYCSKCLALEANYWYREWVKTSSHLERCVKTCNKLISDAEFQQVTIDRLSEMAVEKTCLPKRGRKKKL